MSNNTQHFDELELVAEKAGELNDRVGKIESELGAQTKTLESAALVLDAAIKGLGALKSSVLENDIGALQLALNDKTAHLAREIARFETAVAEIDRRAEAGDEQLAASLRDTALGLRESFNAKNAELAEWSARVEREIAAHSVALAAIPPVIKGADAKPFNPRGEWQAGMIVNSLDVVSYNGSSYISNEDGNTEKPTRSAKYTTLAKRSGNGAGGATDFAGITGSITPAQIVPGQATFAVGDVLYAGTTGTLSKLGAGTSGQLLSTQGAGAAPIWVTATGGAGDVNGPASATDNAIVRFDGTGGKTVQNSAVTIADTTGAIAGASSLTAPASTDLTLTGGSTGASLVLGHTAGASMSSASKLNLSNTTSASSSTVGALTIGNGTTATNVAIGGGNINAGGTLTTAQGDDSTGSGALWQQALAYPGNSFRHFIQSRHSNVTGTGNAIRFYLNTAAGGSTSAAPGTGNAYAFGVDNNTVWVPSTLAATTSTSAALAVAGGIYAGAASVFGSTLGFGSSGDAYLSRIGNGNLTLVADSAGYGSFAVNSTQYPQILLSRTSGSADSKNWVWRVHSDTLLTFSSASDNYGVINPFLSFTRSGATASSVTANVALIAASTAEATTGGAGSLTTAGGIYAAKAIITATHIEGVEQASSPAAPAANGFKIYAKDNGAGKTVLYVRFASGAEQQIAIEP